MAHGETRTKRGRMIIPSNPPRVAVVGITKVADMITIRVWHNILGYATPRCVLINSNPVINDEYGIDING